MKQPKKMKVEKKLFRKFHKSGKYGSASLDPENFSGKMTDVNGHLFQTIDESKDATQYVKTVEALECYAFKTYSVDLSSLFCRGNPELPVIKLPEKTKDENPAKQDIYQLIEGIYQRRKST